MADNLGELALEEELELEGATSIFTKRKRQEKEEEKKKKMTSNIFFLSFLVVLFFLPFSFFPF